MIGAKGEWVVVPVLIPGHQVGGCQYQAPARLTRWTMVLPLDASARHRLTPNIDPLVRDINIEKKTC